MLYHKSIIKDYIDNGKVRGFDITELEKRKDFVMQVAEMSHDKKYYNLLSEEDKKDFEVVKFFMNLFKEDRNFLLDVVDKYFEGKDFDVNDNEYVTTLILLDENRKNVDIDNDLAREMVFKLKLDLFYNTVVTSASNAVQGEDIFNKVYLGTGFLYLENLYKNDKIIKDYIAKRKTMELFPKEEELEKYLHVKYSKEDITKLGVHNFIINHLFMIDESLSKYIACNINLVSELRENITNILFKWDEYATEESLSICEYISDYYNENFTIDVTEQQVFRYLGKKLDRIDLIDYAKEIDKLYSSLEEEIIFNKDVNELEDLEREIKARTMFDDYLPIIVVEEDIDVNQLTSDTLNKLNTLETIVSDMYRNGYEDGYIRKAKEEKSVCKVIPFKPRNNY